MLADAAPYARVAYVFDGRDDDAVARRARRVAGGEGARLSVSYWQQDADGRWQQKA